MFDHFDRQPSDFYAAPMPPVRASAKAKEAKAARSPHDFFAEASKKENLLDAWGVTKEELSDILVINPSLRGMVFGYVAEQKLRDMHFSDRKRITGLIKYDDHDRSRKSDLVATYRGTEIRVEVKSLQTNSIQKSDKKMLAVFQCDASDRRTVRLPDGTEVQTTCLLVGEFDILAVNLYGFGLGWQFAFALNEQLPRSAYSKYPANVREQLLAASMTITWPIAEPFVSDLYPLLEKVVAWKLSVAGSTSASLVQPVLVKQDDVPAQLILAPKRAKSRRS